MSESAFVDAILRETLLRTDTYDVADVDPEYPAPGSYGNFEQAVPARIRYLKFFVENSARLYRTFAGFRDSSSKQLFVALILFRILGYQRVRIPLDRERYFRCRDQAHATPSSPSAIADPPIAHHEVQHDGRTFAIDCINTNVFFTFLLKQYYFRRNGVTIEPQAGDVVVDAGTCFGDTAVDFAHRVGPEGHVYSFEVLQSNCDIATANFNQNPDLKNITLLPYALGGTDREGTQADGGWNPGYMIQGTEPMRSLDALVAAGTIPRVDFIKMDIEGGELDALQGAAESIRKFRPRLAISIYHRLEDYYTIREFIRKQVSGYRFYLENYTISDGETILYATCDRPKRRKRPRRTSTVPGATTPQPE